MFSLCGIFVCLQIKAYQNDQKYKEGKFIIEKAYLKRVTRGKDASQRVAADAGGAQPGRLDGYDPQFSAQILQYVMRDLHSAR